MINHPRPDTWTLPYNGPGEDNDGGAGRTGALAAIDMAALKLQKRGRFFLIKNDTMNSQQMWNPKSTKQKQAQIMNETNMFFR